MVLFLSGWLDSAPTFRRRTINAIWCVLNCLYQNTLSVSIPEVCLQYEVSESVWLLHTETKYIPNDNHRRREEWVMSSNLPTLILDVMF